MARNNSESSRIPAWLTALPPAAGGSAAKTPPAKSDEQAPPTALTGDSDSAEVSPAEEPSSSTAATR
jgi:hypothetical protein